MQKNTVDQSGRFVIWDYAGRSPFASFLPGIAGIMGIPMWVFYVNRGQAIAAFGVESKDAAIMEFQPANKAYQTVPYTGFRTFIKIGNIGSPQEYTFYEPFSPLTSYPRQMAIGANELEIQETAPDYGLQVNVLYFNLTNEPFAGLVRRVTITNTNARPVQLSVLDGLPVVIPYGVNNGFLKDMSRTAEAWMGVFNLEQGIPFYRVRSSIVDKVEVEGYQAGHFYTAFTEAGRLPALVDPQVVFGQDTSLSRPDGFLAQSLDKLMHARQITVGKTPCGFFGIEQTVPPGGALTLYAIIGHADRVETAACECARISNAAYVDAKRRAANDLIEKLTDTVAIKTGEPLLDAYTRQSFLDNVMRGGWPILLGDPARPVVQHVYSRRHGDLERDYNAFYVAPEYYSQGNGAYRDVNQNRREDVWLNPRVEDFNVITFMNLIQADGYNPLIIQGNRFYVPAGRRAAVLAKVKNPGALESFLVKPFTPGELLHFVAANHVELRGLPDAFVSHVLSYADLSFEATFGEGYWIDHWTYNLDLIDNYLTIYPDRKDELLFGKPVFTFYDSAMIVRPRAQKYALIGDRVRQLHAVAEDKEKAALIASRTEEPHAMRVEQGLGPVYCTTLFARLVCLALVKFATRDPLGMGIEMEAGKPGWYDALNGLPGLFGSSMPETYELARLLAFLRGAIAEHSEGQVELPIEVYRFLRSVVVVLEIQDQAGDPDDAQFARVYWDAVAAARETYRERIRLGFDGRTKVMTLSTLDDVLKLFAGKLQAGINRAAVLNPADNGIPPTYFIYEVEEYEPSGDVAHVRRFKPVPLPLFLEGPVHALKMQSDREAAQKLHRQVKASPLFDRRLKMYKVNASLDDQPIDIGRARAFTPGWLENESIWLHMEYKYLLALLKAGLYAEFYEDFRNVLIPFQNPDLYGRSVLENSSFLVSSVHPDNALHGHGFVARLSGSTVEYLSILHHLMIGERPFFVRDNGDSRLCFALRPALAGWLFDETGIVQCKFLGTVTIVYHNPARRDTFGPNAAAPQQYTLEVAGGQPIEITGSLVESPYAAMIREGKIAAIHVILR